MPRRHSHVRSVRGLPISPYMYSSNGRGRKSRASMSAIRSALVSSLSAPLEERPLQERRHGRGRARS
eukprot:3874786-Prymnesium_polylepis.1